MTSELDWIHWLESISVFGFFAFHGCQRPEDTTEITSGVTPELQVLRRIFPL
jgi:hypothetical protein